MNQKCCELSKKFNENKPTWLRLKRNKAKQVCPHLSIDFNIQKCNPLFLLTKKIFVVQLSEPDFSATLANILSEQKNCMQYFSQNKMLPPSCNALKRKFWSSD